ncbi:gliding motility-associated C-terminal domain-containing protein [Flavobacterium sp. LS1R49]|uniref:Gliding motility-associated C-terminal domain-containing protein n=1 Tax=Flavobacterium shii TaxID=2987687 RepID=A0A9X2ZDA0_9FLAO|nr:gliding motility-associated C-terminal domain-containing protein [Flavobacterium shii]MCV9927225.1 gliding motility-associated C-terminal domain-containing protein [Flavobacterium shii]
MKFKTLLSCYIFTIFFLFISDKTFSQCFEIQSILVDACDGTAEGFNEMVRFKVGSAPLDMSTLVVSWPNNSWKGLVEDVVTASKVAQLNADIVAAGGCRRIIEPPGGIIPANATVILVTSFNMSPSANPFGPLSEDIYMIFQNNPTTSSGHFANFGVGLRTLTMALIGGCARSVTYDRALLTDINGNNVAADGATVDFTPAGVASYVNYGCQAPIPPFIVNAGPPTLTACAGATIALNGTALGEQSVAWTSPVGTFSSSNTTVTNYTIPLASGGSTIVLKLEATNICGDKISDVINLTVNSNTRPDFATTLTLCNGATAPVLATTSPNGITGTWSPAAIDNAISGNYVFTPTAGLCATTTTLAVTVNPNVTPDFATTLTLCNGATAPVLATTSPNGITGTWNPAAIDNTISGNYVFTPDAGQCATITTLAVTVNPNVTPDFATTLTLCNGATAAVLATTSPNGITGTWSPATIDNTISGNYVFTPTAGLCATTTTLAVTVNPNVTPDFATTLTLCNGATAPVLATNSPNGITGTWSPATIDNTTNGNYVFTPTAGLCATTTTLAVTVNPNVTPDFATTLTLCNGATAAVLATTSPNGITGTWNPAAIDNTTSGNYVFTPTAGLCATTTTLAVMINPNVTPDFVTTLTLCNGATAPVLATTSPNGITGTWSPAAIDNSTSGNYVFTPTAGQCATITTLVVTITPSITPDFATTLTLCNGATAPVLATTSPNGITGTWNPAAIDNTISGNYVFTPTVGQCATTTTLVVTITQSITPDFATTLTLCTGGSVPILATRSPNGITGTWSPAIISNAVSGNYVFTAAAGQCATGITLNVIIKDINFSTTQQCINNEYLVKVISDTNSSDYQYTWTNNIGNIVGNNSANFNFTDYVRNNSSITLPLEFKVTVSNGTCQKVETVLITEYLCGVPTAISPNGDGINDNFDLTGFNVNDVEIFNRWGRKVYHYSGKYVNEWYGQSDDGKTLPNGTYYYVIKSNVGAGKAGWVFISY